MIRLRNIALYRRVDLLWMFFSVFSRVVPLSIIPILIRSVDKKDLDWFVLIQTNASLLAIIFGFSQGGYIQRTLSSKRIPATIMVTASVPILFLIIAIGIALIFTKDYFLWMNTLILSFCIAYVQQTQALAQVTKRFSIIVIADCCRILIFFGFTLFLYWDKSLTAQSMVLLVSIFYILPFLFFFEKYFSFKDVKHIYNESHAWLSSVSWMGILSVSSLISVAAWMSIRYFLSLFGQTGELSSFAAIMSVSSLLALVVDLIYIRLGKAIINATQSRSAGLLWTTAKKAIILMTICAIGVIFTSIIYVNFQFGHLESKYLISTILINIGYQIRGIYIFFQYVLIGLGMAKFDFVASILMLIFSSISAKWLITSYGIVGASALFMCVSLICLLVLTFGATKYWNKL